MDFFEYDVVERQLVVFQKKMNKKLEKDHFNEKTNSKFICASLCLDYSPDNNIFSNQRKDKVDKRVYELKGFSSKRQYLPSLDAKGNKVYNPHEELLDIIRSIIASILDIVVLVEEQHPEEPKVLYYQLPLIKVYLLSTSVSYEIGAEEEGTVKDLKMTLLKMMEKDKRVKLQSKWPNDYDLFYYKANSSDERSKVSFGKAIDETILVETLKSKVLSIELRKEKEPESILPLIVEVEDKEVDVTLKVYYDDIEGFQGAEEVIINNSRTLSDVLDTLMNKKNFVCKNRDLYYFTMHSKKIIQQANDWSDNILDREIPLSQIRQYEFELKCMLFPDIKL